MSDSQHSSANSAPAGRLSIRRTEFKKVITREWHSSSKACRSASLERNLTGNSNLVDEGAALTVDVVTKYCEVNIFLGFQTWKYLEHPRDFHFPMEEGIVGGEGGAAPLEKMFNRFGPPQDSAESPEQGKLQSVIGALTPEFSMKLSQSTAFV